MKEGVKERERERGGGLLKAEIYFVNTSHAILRASEKRKKKYFEIKFSFEFYLSTKMLLNRNVLLHQRTIILLISLLAENWNKIEEPSCFDESWLRNNVRCKCLSG